MHGVFSKIHVNYFANSLIALFERFQAPFLDEWGESEKCPVLHVLRHE